MGRERQIPALTILAGIHFMYHTGLHNCLLQTQMTVVKLITLHDQKLCSHYEYIQYPKYFQSK
jgi:hypothetical protein